MAIKSHSLPGVYKSKKLFYCEKGTCDFKGGQSRAIGDELSIEGGAEIFGGLRRFPGGMSLRGEFTPCTEGVIPSRPFSAMIKSRMFYVFHQ